MGQQQRAKPAGFALCYTKKLISCRCGKMNEGLVPIESRYVINTELHQVYSIART